MTEARFHGHWSRRLAVVALVAFLAGPALATSSAISALVGFALFVLGGLLSAGVSLTAAVAWARGKKVPGITALLLGGIPGIVLISLAIQGRHYPPINDISTDLGDPPAFVQAQSLPPNRGRDFSYPEGFKDIVRQAYPSLKSISLTDPPQKVFASALLLARALPTWEITRVDRDSFTFEGVDTTRVFKFQDDFLVRIRPEGEGSVVDMRSKSRDGKGDIGANAHRIRMFLEKLSALSR